jgi:hypothetical protein
LCLSTHAFPDSSPLAPSLLPQTDFVSAGTHAPPFSDSAERRFTTRPETRSLTLAFTDPMLEKNEVDGTRPDFAVTGRTLVLLVKLLLVLAAEARRGRSKVAVGLALARVWLKSSRGRLLKLRFGEAAPALLVPAGGPRSLVLVRPRARRTREKSRAGRRALGLRRPRADSIPAQTISVPISQVDIGTYFARANGTFS